MLKLKYSQFNLECGTDEAGRGCLAGPVTAAADHSLVVALLPLASSAATFAGQDSKF